MPNYAKSEQQKNAVAIAILLASAIAFGIGFEAGVIAALHVWK